ncbi:hypothetical protein DXT76_15190 [Halobacillus trueperi]|uniref:Intein N-terminal splicing region n=2 Tax=Halobacillus TaxID=45667 RepID=A0A1H0LSK3_HALAD|nr:MULTISPECIES: hypothetical protein [Halobacillus]RDY70067.1 hypothetical protein DXT76_15190 [Halobacillus trueperi]SDO70860.1 intein N-terminal splicing region [Halobacillus aidingensis]
MKKLFVVLLLLVVGCSVAGKDVNAFEGHVTEVKVGGLEVECSSAVENGEVDDGTEEGWPCLVLVPHDTPVYTNDGENLKMETFREQAREEKLLKIRVQLSESTEITEDPESRKVTAKEITVLE